MAESCTSAVAKTATNQDARHDLLPTDLLPRPPFLPLACGTQLGFVVKGRALHCGSQPRAQELKRDVCGPVLSAITVWLACCICMVGVRDRCFRACAVHDEAEWSGVRLERSRLITAMD